MKWMFYAISLPAILIFGLLSWFWPWVAWFFVLIGPLFLLGVYDTFQRHHTVLRNFPLLGRVRFMLEYIRPEIYQYFVESDQDGRPFNRETRSVIYQRAKGVLDTQPYGTRKNVYEIEYEWINHSLNAKFLKDHDPRVTVGNDQCKQPYGASILNISAMSFGALSSNAVMALNRGAKEGRFYQNTGEGGLTPHHLKYGGDIVWQLGTGYFGCRAADGTFSPEYFKEKATLPNVKMIEIKISQGAKPGHGGILPAKKVTEEIAKIRGVSMGHDVISPPTHSSFTTPLELMAFITQLRELSGGKPVGFKLCLGSRKEFMGICKAMLKTGIHPDFITVDGGEGGTGAAPLEFANGVGTPLVDALPFVHNALVGVGVRDKIRIICSGKLVTGFQIAARLAQGADMVNVARPMMMAIGCIQSLKCNTNRCPTGVTTQDAGLRYGLVVEDKYKRVAEYHRETVKAAVELVGATGLNSPSELRPAHVFRRISATQVKPLDEIYAYLEPSALLKDPVPEAYARSWNASSAEHF